MRQPFTYCNPERKCKKSPRKPTTTQSYCFYFFPISFYDSFGIIFMILHLFSGFVSCSTSSTWVTLLWDTGISLTEWNYQQHTIVQLIFNSITSSVKLHTHTHKDTFIDIANISRASYASVISWCWSIAQTKCRGKIHGWLRFSFRKWNLKPLPSLEIYGCRRC